MGLLDFILFPVYVYIFHLIFSARRKRIADPVLQKYYKHGFRIKVASAFAFAIFSYYISPGDSISLYFPEGANICKLILKDFSNIKWIFVAGKDFDTSIQATLAWPGYFANESNFFIMRLVAILSFFSFASYLIITLMFALFAFTGAWRLFKFFYEQYPHLHKQLAIAIIYLPTFVFWSSGILKDSVCIGMLGWMTYAIYNIFYKKQQIVKNSLIAAVSLYTLVIVKIYIVVSYLPFLILFLFLKNVGKIKNNFAKVFAGLFMTLITVVGFAVVADRLQDELGMFAVDKLTQSVKAQQSAFLDMADGAGSSFSLGVEFDGSVSSLVRLAPAAVIATFYRPFLWESKKVSTLLSSIESLVIMFFTLYVFFKVGPFNFFGSIFKSPMILFCFCFSIVFGLFVGATTLNFGTLVRYKIPCLPFYLMTLYIILDIYRKKKAALKLKNSLH